MSKKRKTMDKEKLQKHMDDLYRLYNMDLDFADEICNERNRKDRLADKARRNGDDLDGIL
ncbi:MAG: hypothetical protein WC516_09040 [Patescibacteria group bacterium]|jgi:hypothetical protein